MKYKAIEDIDTLKELRKQQKKLRKKLHKREKKLSEKFTFTPTDDEEDDIISGILENIGITNTTVARLLPILFQYRKEILQSKILQISWRFLRKNPYISLSATGVAIGFVLYNKAVDFFKENASTKEADNDQSSAEKETIEPGINKNANDDNDVMF